MATVFRWEKLRKRKLWVLAAVVFLVMLGLSVWWFGPAPPRRLVLATGRAGGAHALFGKKYQDRLRRMGLKLELMETSGSLENLELLVQGKADVAFVQGGTYPLVQDPDKVLRGLASLYLEPLWFFYRGKEVQSLTDFKHKKIALGFAHSGTDAAGRLILQANGIDANDATFLNLDMHASADRLRAGTLDVALFVSSAQNPLIVDLLKTDGIHLLSFKRQEAYCRRFPYLTPVKLAEGVVDLAHNVPSEEIALLAPAAILACRDNLHPRAIELLLNAAQAIHAPSSVVDQGQKFPSLNLVDLPIHETAENYMRSGESLLSRLLPYWGVRLIYQVQVLILPILLVWLPFLKILPAIYAFRVNRLLRHHYVALRELENAMEKCDDVAHLRELIHDLDQLRTAIAWVSRKIPAHLQSDVYNWRLHVAMVHAEALERLHRLEAKEAAVRQE
jgi:TRAP transporter TAXI family solute receptor